MSLSDFLYCYSVVHVPWIHVQLWSIHFPRCVVVQPRAIKRYGGFRFVMGVARKNHAKKSTGFSLNINYHVWGSPIFRKPQIAPILGLPPIPRYPQDLPRPRQRLLQSHRGFRSTGQGLHGILNPGIHSCFPHGKSTRNEESIGNSHRRNSSFFGGLLQVQVLPIFS